MITGATLRAVHVVLELTIDLRVEDLSSASISTEDTNTVPGIDSLQPLTSVDLGATTEHHR